MHKNLISIPRTMTRTAFLPVWLVADCMVTALEVKPYGTGQTLVPYSRVSDPDSIRSVFRIQEGKNDPQK